MSVSPICLVLPIVFEKIVQKSKIEMNFSSKHKYYHPNVVVVVM
jgi:hypothetical protein